MSRRGQNPCLVCEELVSGPKGGVVCLECRRKVAAYEQMRDSIKARTATISIKAHPYVGNRGQGSPAGSALDELLRGLRRSLGEIPRGPSGYHPAAGELHEEMVVSSVKLLNTGYSENYTRYRAPIELAQFLADLEPTLKLALEEAVAQGKAQGTNLLAQLAAGTITSDAFERSAGIQGGGKA